MDNDMALIVATAHDYFDGWFGGDVRAWSERSIAISSSGRLGRIRHPPRRSHPAIDIPYRPQCAGRDRRLEPSLTRMELRSRSHRRSCRSTIRECGHTLAFLERPLDDESAEDYGGASWRA
jgi:hypothetical protein